MKFIKLHFAGMPFFLNAEKVLMLTPIPKDTPSMDGHPKPPKTIITLGYRESGEQNVHGCDEPVHEVLERLL